MILKFKRFWSSLILVACTLGLITPMPSRANGNVELQVVGIVGACAAIGGLIGLGAGSVWLKSCKADAQILQQNAPNNPNGTISIDEWCTRKENEGVVIARDAAFKGIVDEALGANEDALIFKKSYLKEQNKYAAFIKDIHSEMHKMQGVMEGAKSFSFVSGLTEFPRTAFKLFPDLDWKYTKFKDMCARNNLVERNGYVYPERWTADNFQNMENAVYQYIEDVIPEKNGITKLATEVWWIYFKKYYRLQKLKNVISAFSSELERERQSRADNNANTAAAVAAATAHTHQHVHVNKAEEQKPQLQPQPVQPLQVAQQKPNYLKWAAYTVCAALMGVGLYSSGKMVAQTLNINTGL